MALLTSAMEDVNYEKKNFNYDLRDHRHPLWVTEKHFLYHLKKDKNGNGGEVPDSLRGKFETANGRVVFDGKGIKPDIVTPKRKLSMISSALIRNFHVFNKLHYGRILG